MCFMLTLRDWKGLLNSSSVLVLQTALQQVSIRIMHDIFSDRLWQRCTPYITSTRVTECGWKRNDIRPHGYQFMMTCTNRDTERVEEILTSALSHHHSVKESLQSADRLWKYNCTESTTCLCFMHLYVMYSMWQWHYIQWQQTNKTFKHPNHHILGSTM